MILVTHQVDKEALDKQVKDEIEYRTKQEKAKEQFGVLSRVFTYLIRNSYRISEPSFSKSEMTEFGSL